jgi:hypothetical protein
MAHAPHSPSPKPINSPRPRTGHRAHAPSRPWPCPHVLLSGLLGLTLACSKSTPPPVETPSSAPSVAMTPNHVENAPGGDQTSAQALDKSAPPSSATSSDKTPGGTASTSNAVGQEPTPLLTDSTGNPLPQTEVRPTLDSPSFKRRLELLVSAIAEDQPDTATPAFFPQIAYAQVKAIKDPNRDWERRLQAAFARNIHEYHKQLGSDPQSLRLVRLEVPEAKVKWMKPGAEGNRVGYFRVTRSKLVVAKADGKEVSLDLTSLISWRGEWYVVHLHGFD